MAPGRFVPSLDELEDGNSSLRLGLVLELELYRTVSLLLTNGRPFHRVFSRSPSSNWYADAIAASLFGLWDTLLKNIGQNFARFASASADRCRVQRAPLGQSFAIAFLIPSNTLLF